MRHIPALGRLGSTTLLLTYFFLAWQLQQPAARLKYSCKEVLRKGPGIEATYRLSTLACLFNLLLQGFSCPCFTLSFAYFSLLFLGSSSHLFARRGSFLMLVGCFELFFNPKLSLLFTKQFFQLRYIVFSLSLMPC